MKGKKKKGNPQEKNKKKIKDDWLMLVVQPHTYLTNQITQQPMLRVGWGMVG